MFFLSGSLLAHSISSFVQWNGNRVTNSSYFGGVVLANWEHKDDAFLSKILFDSLLPENSQGLPSKSDLQVVESHSISSYDSQLHHNLWELEWEDSVVKSIRFGIIESNIRFYHGFDVNLMSLSVRDLSHPFSFSLILLPGFALTQREITIKGKAVSFRKAIQFEWVSKYQAVSIAPHRAELIPNRKLTRYYSRLTHSDPEGRG
ncbi:hypothetical protein [Leptospira perolatii]|uniref:hypothetical protein n=1 Tax=Leptospira perolatii TaxID=2023191 RepID=UPI000F6322E4|nr:hypothetical protein [Leptospira perolatii]